MALRTDCGLWRETVRDMRSARRFNEALEDMESFILSSSSFMNESSCNFNLFLDPEREPESEAITGNSGPVVG